MIIVEEQFARQKSLQNKFGHGAPITGETANRMLRMYRKRMELAHLGHGVGITNMKDEPNNVYFTADQIVGLKLWDHLGIGFGLTKFDGTNRTPPNAADEASWNSNPGAVRMVHTAIIGETDSKGHFLFKKDASYVAYDFAGTCCL